MKRTLHSNHSSVTDCYNRDITRSLRIRAVDLRYFGVKSVLFMAALAASSVFGQDISGTIEGTVLDPSQKVITNAKVTVTNTDRNQVVRQITTNGSGVFVASSIPAGPYSLQVEATGFKSELVSNIRLNVNDDVKLNVTLQVGAVTESVEVHEDAARVELSSVANASVVQGIQIRELPLATRNYEQLVALTPGVTASASDELYIGNSAPAGTAATLPFSINGNRSSANNWTV